MKTLLPKRLRQILLLVMAVLLWRESKSQICESTVPSFTINLTGNPAGVWTSSNVVRSGTCCNQPKAECVYFNLTLDPGAAGIQMDMDGADPPGSLFYKLSCGTSFPGGSIKCISGVGPHQITLCKPGGNANIYRITSISKPKFPKDDTVRIGCKFKFNTLGIRNDSVAWRSVYPGTSGQYNLYLDSVNVASPTYSPAANAPAYVDYEVCGYPQASGCGFSITVCDTVRIYNFAPLTGTVTPNPASFCNVGPGSGVTLTASAGGGQASYVYTWRNSTNSVVGTGSSYFASLPGSYNVEIGDQLSVPGMCPNIFKPASVIQGTVPVAEAGANQKLCSTNTLATLSGSVQYATGGIWSGGTGTFSPGNLYLNTNYTPSAAELAAGFAKLYLTSTGAGGGCVNSKDSLMIYYSAPPAVSIPVTTLACYNSTAVLQPSVTGGVVPLVYSWNTGASTQTIVAGQGVYSLLVTDSLGCTGAANTSLTAPPPLNINFNVSNVTVNGGSNGSATVNIGGGTPPYSTSWLPGPQTSTVYSGLAFGIYTASVTDANNCNLAASTIVNEPRCLGFSASAVHTDISCFGFNNGSATVTASGGAGPYTYTWNTSPVQNASVAVNLNAAVHSAVISDANACLQTINVAVTQPNALTNVITHTNVSTIGGTDGAATAFAFGGSFPYNFLWSNGVPGASITGVQAGMYTVSINDDRGCARVDSVLITQPPCNNLTFNVLTTNVFCSGGSNGSAIAIAGGVSGSYTISWSTGQTGPSVTGLSAGNYSVSLTDSKGCFDFRNFSITEPSPFSVGVQAVGIQCYGDQNGTIDLTVSGGNYPYTFLWSNGATSEDIVNLAPGSYSVTAMDNKGCSGVAVAVITQPQPLSITHAVQHVNCINGTTGSINITPAGGVQPYTYTWSNGANTQDLTNLSAGGYTVTITDANNCTYPYPPIIGVNEPDSVKADSFAVACPVPGSGVTSVTVFPTGGFSPVYQVSFNNGLSYQGTGNYSALLNNGQTYSVMVKDGNNCVSIVPATLAILAETRIDSVVFNKCFPAGTNTALALLYASGGDGGPYSIAYTGVGFQAPGTYSFNLNTGSAYTLTSRDGRNCVSPVFSTSITAPLTAITNIASNYNGAAISCFGLSDGSASVSVSGGKGPYTYSWSVSPLQTAATATALAAGAYTVYVTDNNLCATSSTVNLVQPAAVSATALVISNYNGAQISCFGAANGSAMVNATGGTGAYSYTWSTLPAQSSATAIALAAGNYTITIKDANNCSGSTSLSVSQPSALSGTTSVISNYNGQNISCFGANNGSATAVASGGTGAYSYSWTTMPAQTSATATGLGAGTYSVFITDANNCETNRSVTLTQPGAITATAVISSNYNGQAISCFGASNGSASVTAIGGTGAYTYSWSTLPSQAAATATGLAAGTYSVRVDDVNSCSVTAMVTLNQPGQLTASATVSSNYNGQNISCFGASNGSANVVAAGGTGAYSYTWSTSPAQTGATAGSLSAGAYTVLVNDVNLCSTTASITLTQPSALGASLAVSSNYNGQHISCFGGSNGSASVSATGGTGAYTYTWNTSPLQIGNTATNLQAGTYSVQVRDVNNCLTSGSITLTQPPALSATASVISNYNGQNISCYGASNGSAAVVAVGGTGAYSYSWTTLPAQTSATATGLGAGTYSVFITDANNCATSRSVTLTQPGAITATAVISSNYNGQAISCFGGTNGSASVTANGGTGAYTYSWSTLPSQAAATATGLAAGTYSVRVSDVNSCSVIAVINLTQPALLTASATVSSNYNGQNISCFGASNGSANVVAAGGTGSYSYTWSTSPVQNAATAGSLAAGSYTVLVNDVNLCSSTATITLSQPAALVASLAVSSNYNGQQISCFGGSNGSASVSATGGTGAYTYTWNTSPLQIGSTASNLQAGNYTVQVRDANNCLTSGSITLTQPPALAATASVISNYNGQSISCFGGSDGIATVTVSGGTGAYTYTWNSVPAQNSATATSLSAGIYSMIAGDVNSCTVVTSVVLNQPAPMNVATAVTSNYNGQHVSCYGSSNGSASVSAGGGSGSFTYLWNSSPQQTTAIATNLAAGSYTVVVTDFNGCVSAGSVTLSQPAAISATINNISNYNGYSVRCAGDTDGFVDVSVNGGTGAYSYTWSNGSNLQDLNNGAAGGYTLTVSDLNNCIASLSLSLTEPPVLAVVIDSLSSYNGFGTRCHDSKDGSVYVTVTGGVAAYNYLWNTGAITDDISGAGSGSYALNITDRNGCLAYIDTLLTSPPAFTLSALVTKPFCNGVADGKIDVSLSGGIVPYTYTWSNGASTEDINNIAAGSFTVSALDLNKCLYQEVIVVTQPPSILLSKDIVSLKCYGDTTGRIALNIAGGTTPYNFEWSNNKTTRDLSGLSAGTYLVKVTDVNGCFIRDTTTLTQPGQLSIQLESPLRESGSNISLYGGSDGSINLTVSGGSSPYTYLWSTGEKNEDISGLKAGTYQVTISDLNGCRASDQIALSEPQTLEMPSGYSPNDDGKNDYFVVRGISAYPDNKFTVYNRWGNIVYSKNGYNNEWNGNSNLGMALPPATYFVLLEINRGEKVLKGYVELRR